MKNWIDYWQAVGGRITWNRSLLRGAWTVPWLQVRARLRRRRRRGTIAYFPQPAAPWYTLPLALAGSGIKRTNDLFSADVIMMFDDRAQSKIDLPDGLEESGALILNRFATDITKRYVGQVFESVFGYPLAVDPHVHDGPMVEKSDDNGIHDGRIVRGPLKTPKPDCSYQRLADSTVRPGVTEDLRCICVGGQIVQLFRKEKAMADRFSTRYLQTTLHEAEELLSPRERQQIAAFCQKMGLDFGSIDVLRDHARSGRIYIVDVNKTCMPVLSMPVRELQVALDRVGRAVETLVFGPGLQSQSMPAELESVGFVAGQVKQL